MIKNYTIYYDDEWIADLTIDPCRAEEPIRNMVEFWADWDSHVSGADGDYTQVFLENLACFIARNARIPGRGEQDDGWYSLDGTNGITVVNWGAVEEDRDLVSIQTTL